MHNTQNMRRVAIFVILASMCLFYQKPLSAEVTVPRIYETGTKVTLTARWLGLSAAGNLEILENTQFGEKDVVLVRSQVTKLGGFMGFIVKFLRMYRGSNTFDSYIDTDTRMVVKYENYKLSKDGSKEINEHVYFDREQNRIVSLVDNRVIASNVAPDIQGTFSAFLTLLYRLNTERLFLGKKFVLKIYGYEEVFKVKVEVTHRAVRDGTVVYTLEVKELPAVFKYPASLAAEVTDVGESFIFPARGKCEIRLSLLPDITVKAKLRATRRGD